MKTSITKKYIKGKKDYIINSDTNLALADFNDNSIDLMVTSPGYFVGKKYEIDKSFADYLEYHTKTVNLLYDKLASNGSVFWNVAQTPLDNEIIPLGAIYYKIFKDAGFYLKNWIIWHFEGGINTKNRLSGRYENILWFVKDKDNYKFNLDDIRIPAKWQNDPRVNPKGKNPTDVWEFKSKDLKPEEIKYFIEQVKKDNERSQSDLSDNFLYIDRVVNVSNEKTIHPCQFPEKLIERIIKASSNKGDMVVDIFLGSGTTAKVSRELKRNFIGIDLDLDYCKVSQKRIDDVKDEKDKRK
ncbi:MAG: site-specific DNA-methyltransferase [Candidatus Paceibacterota bacterium]|jgi:site-specific DNA-methyltransferase (adenine-specific)/adenine-specific DNA-methyltransferase